MKATTKMKKAELIQLAEENHIDISDCKNNRDRVTRINSEFEHSESKESEPVESGYVVTSYPIVLDKANKSGSLISEKNIVLPSFMYDNAIVSSETRNETRWNISSAVYSINIDCLQSKRKDALDSFMTAERERSEAEMRHDDKQKYSFILESARCEGTIKRIDSKIKALNTWAAAVNVRYIDVDTLPAREKAILFWTTVSGKSNKFKGYKFDIASHYDLYVHGLNVFSVFCKHKGLQELNAEEFETLKLFRSEFESDIQTRFEVPESVNIHVENNTILRICMQIYDGVKKDKKGNPILSLIRERSFLNTCFREEVYTIFNHGNMEKKKNGKILMKL